ncbi:FG-GAP-like repeat-containing protein [Gloeobacter violaceus]|uniref:Gll1277 protein n=1 Tax=Gloeobacter violaceus (strain ATCC 29082 / PCC 7421) TaxID=251221 RepID=Q7NL49_GLOVI|nr:FG-GAP-like repeat-containing protein [Gloeobacter violaceus]BAC89218.1 gll1277 [Gloeobacter violaceus PCC 7421]
MANHSVTQRYGGIVRRLISTTLCLQALLGAAVPAVAAPTGEIKIGENAKRQIEALMREKARRTPTQRKIDSQLLYALKQQRGESFAQGVGPLRLNVERDGSGRALVDIKAQVTPALLAKIESLGGTVRSSVPRYSAVRAWVPLARLEELAALSEVTFIRRAAKAQLNKGNPRPLQDAASLARRIERVKQQLPEQIRLAAQNLPEDAPVLNVGSVTSEGDKAHTADTARSTYGVNGTGIKIGVLSDSYNCQGAAAADIASGDLPAAGVTVLQEDPGCSSGSDEGRAMLQIVHDLAPGAQLYFATAFESVEGFAENIVALKNAGCTVIVDDVEYFNESPFQDAPIAQAVNEVTAAGVAYFSSAGNSGNLTSGTSSVWEGNFVDSGEDLIIDGESVGAIHSFNGSTANQQLDSSSEPAYLFWSDALGASANDYDLYIIDSTGSFLVDFSTDPQTGTEDPVEAASAGPGDLLVVTLVDGDPRYLHLNVGRGLLASGTSGRTKGHSAASKAFSVAAVPVATAAGGAFTGGAANPVEDFSSDGPRRVFYNADGSAITPGNVLATGGAVRQKPDIAAADGVVTTLPPNSGLNPFFGTSAAAPHAAAIAALLKSLRPTITLDQLRSVLTTTTLDNMAAGVDRDSGFGIVMALRALQAPVGGGLVRGDFSGDGKADILWRNGATGANTVWRMNGTAFSSSVALTSVSDRNWTIGGASDFTADGKTDILWRNGATGQNTIWIMNGTALSSTVTISPVSDPNWQIVGTGDFSGDGKPDILWRNKATGANSVWIMNGTAFSSSVALSSVGDLNWEIVAAADFSGDGKPDILWRNKASGANSVWIMNGTTFSSSVALSPVGDPNWQIGGAADYSGDGKPDILWRNKASGANSVWIMNGTAFSSSVALTPVADLNWRIAGPR